MKFKTVKERDNFILDNMKLVGVVIKSYNFTPVTEDLIQEGYIELIRCVDSFDETRDIKFSSYACKNIYYRLKTFLIKDSALVKPYFKDNKYHYATVNFFEDFVTEKEVDDFDPDDMSLENYFGKHSNIENEIVYNDLINEFIKSIKNEKHRKIFEYYIYYNLSQTEIARKMSITRSRVNNIIRNYQRIWRNNIKGDERFL